MVLTIPFLLTMDSMNSQMKTKAIGIATIAPESFVIMEQPTDIAHMIMEKKDFSSLHLIAKYIPMIASMMERRSLLS